VLTTLPPGVVTAVGSLPHVDPREAAELVLELLPDLPAIPSLPRRHPAEGMLGQAAAGVRGVEVLPDGGLRVDARRLDPAAPVVTDLDHEAFGGFRTFLEVAAGRQGPVKWQTTGPVTLGTALVHAGAPVELAYPVAAAAVRARADALAAAVDAALPKAKQLVVLDEPALVGLGRDLPLGADPAADLVSGALARLEARRTTGLHCCGPTDVATLLAAGPAVLSVPATADLLGFGGTLATWLEGGGWVAWGAVPTDRPLGTADRTWRALAGLWCELVKLGVDPVRVRMQALLTPACGLALHTPEQAVGVLRTTARIAARVHQQATAVRFSAGA
jgi:hypothetical protein